jgi:hypothetical protein
MLVQVRVKLENKRRAQSLVESVRKRFKPTKSRIITRDSIKSYIQNHYREKFKTGLLRAINIGFFFGLISGVIIQQILLRTDNLGDNSFTFSFAAITSIAVFATALSAIFFVINKEKMPSMSVYDINDSEALAVISIEKDKLDSVIKAINEVDPLSVRVV